jgi:hypothetical protein
MTNTRSIKHHKAPMEVRLPQNKKTEGAVRSAQRGDMDLKISGLGEAEALVDVSLNHFARRSRFALRYA